MRAARGGLSTSGELSKQLVPVLKKACSDSRLVFGTWTRSHFADTTVDAHSDQKFVLFKSDTRPSLLAFSTSNWPRVPNYGHLNGHLTRCRSPRERWGYLPHTDNISYMPATTLHRLDEPVASPIERWV